MVQKLFACAVLCVLVRNLLLPHFVAATQVDVLKTLDLINRKYKIQMMHWCTQGQSYCSYNTLQACQVKYLSAV